MGIFGAVVGSAFVICAFSRKGLSRKRRWIFAYVGICFYVYGALEFFRVIRLESM